MRRCSCRWPSQVQSIARRLPQSALELAHFGRRETMERQEQQTRQIQEPTAPGEDQPQATPAEPDHQEPVTPSPLQKVRALLDSARRSQSPVASRRELGRDKSKSLFVLVGASVALLLLFFGVFSSPKNRGPLPGETARGGPSLGRKVAPGQEQSDPAKTVTPLLSAD